MTLHRMELAENTTDDSLWNTPFSRSLLDKLCLIHDCTNIGNRREGILRERAAISSVEYALRQMVEIESMLQLMREHSC